MPTCKCCGGTGHIGVKATKRPVTSCGRMIDSTEARKSSTWLVESSFEGKTLKALWKGQRKDLRDRLETLRSLGAKTRVVER